MTTHLIELVEPGAILSFLLEIGFKSALILACAGLVTSVFRKSSAALRYTIWTTALVLALILPAFVLVSPKVDVPVLPPSEKPVATGSFVDGLSSSSERLSASSSFDAGIEGAQTKDRSPAVVDDPVAPASASDASVSAGRNAFLLDADWRLLLIGLWLIGILLVTVRYAVGILALRRVRRAASPVADVEIRLTAIRIARRLGLNRRVALVWGPTTSMPMTWGWRTPTVLLPEAAREWDAGRLHLVLQHEIAHVKRWDCLIQIPIYLACTIYWFNPLVWIAAAQTRREREMACDDFVLRAGAHGPDYATHLLEIARSLKAPSFSSDSTIAMARPSELEGRLMAILNSDRSRRAATAKGLVATFGILACLALPLSALRPVPITPPAVNEPDRQRLLEPLSPGLDGRAPDLRSSERSEPRQERQQLRITRETSRATMAALATAGAEVADQVKQAVQNIEIRGPDPISWTSASASVSNRREVVKPDTIPLHQIKRLKAAGVDIEFIDAMISLGFDQLTVEDLIQLAHAGVDVDDVKALRTAGYTNLTPTELVRLSHADVDVDEIGAWSDLGYSGLTTQDLVRLAHADVDIDYVRAMAAAGYEDLPVGELVRMAHADVDPEFITEMHDLGMTDLTLEDLIGLSHADVDAEFVAAMRTSGYDNLSIDDLIGLSHADVDPRYIRELAEMGLTDLTTSDLVRLGHADVDARFIRQMREAGFNDLDAGDLVRLSHADVDPDYVAEIKAAGFSDVSLEDMVRLSHADVDIDFIKEMGEAGYTDLLISELINLGHADVDGAMVRELAELGLTGLTAEELAGLGHADVDRWYVRELRAAGLRELTAEELVQLGHADVDADYIVELRQAGLTNLTAEDLIKLGHADVDDDFIEEMRELGFDTNDADEIVQLKHMDMDLDYIKRARRALQKSQN